MSLLFAHVANARGGYSGPKLLRGSGNSIEFIIPEYPEIQVGVEACDELSHKVKCEVKKSHRTNEPQKVREHPPKYIYSRNLKVDFPA